MKELLICAGMFILIGFCHFDLASVNRTPIKHTIPVAMYIDKPYWKKFIPAKDE